MGALSVEEKQLAPVVRPVFRLVPRVSYFFFFLSGTQYRPRQGPVFVDLDQGLYEGERAVKT